MRDYDDEDNHGCTHTPHLMQGVVSTHGMVGAQVGALVGAWQWTPRDVIYNVLPLHHIHGLINVLTCALYTGACVEMPSAFDPAKTVRSLSRKHNISSSFAIFCLILFNQWRRFQAGGLSLFMAVPTVYARLIQHYESLPEDTKAEFVNSFCFD